MPRPGSELHGRRREAPPQKGEPRVPLRLTVARGALGLELYEPIELGPISIERLELSFENLRFPIDLSGGVPTFRHHRGKLEYLELTLSLSGLSRYLSRRLRDVLGGLERPVTIWAIEQGLGVGLLGKQGALAFDLLWAPVEGDARFILVRARGARLDGIALAIALQVVETAVGRFSERHGRMFRIPRVGYRIARQVLPSIGARVPRPGLVRASHLEAHGDDVRTSLDSNHEPPAASFAATRAVEFALLTADADDHLAKGQVEDARGGLMTALEQAPRHPGIVELLAEVDLRVAERAEAALSMLAESMPIVEGGAVAAELLARAGDLDAARLALEKATRTEEFAPIAALRWLRLAEMETSLAGRLTTLDQAVARAPGLSAPRWARLRARLERGDVSGAIADAQHLEAAAVGASARHEVDRRAARMLLEAGFVGDAGKLFERALRYVPDDIDATAGLARALLELGKVERATTLLERAIEIGDVRGEVDGLALVELAKLLAERVGDLPQAIARVRAVPASSAASLEARFLEGRWRARLGDLVGASLAFTRARESLQIAQSVESRQGARWLEEAASFESDVMGEPALAERHLAVAIRLRSDDRNLAAMYRRVAGEAAARLKLRREAGKTEPDR